MKTTGNYDWVISTWIKQSQYEGHSPRAAVNAGAWRNGNSFSGGSRMFFRGDTIYDYHEWWPMAKILPGKIALINRETYSVTTSSHTGQVYSMLDRAGFTCFAVERNRDDCLEPDPSYLLAEFKRIYGETSRARDRLASKWIHDPLEYLKTALHLTQVGGCFSVAIRYTAITNGGRWQKSCLAKLP